MNLNSESISGEEVIYRQVCFLHYWTFPLRPTFGWGDAHVLMGAAVAVGVGSMRGEDAIWGCWGISVGVCICVDTDDGC